MSNNKLMIYYIFIVFLSNLFLSAVPHILLKPYWSLDFEYLPQVTLFEALYTLIILPITLIKLNKRIFKKTGINRIHYLITSLVVIFISILVSNFLHYKNFGDMTGRANDPDIGTRILSLAVPSIAIIIVFVDIGIKLFREFKKEN